VFNRPNKRGSLLSPLGWRLLATCFGVLAFVGGAATIHNPDIAGVVGTIAAAAMAYACVMAARGQNIEPPPAARVFPAETSLLQLEGFAPAGFRHGVEILNDDRTTMDFVVSVLKKNVGLDEPAAIRTMLEIHRSGGVILARESLEEAKRLADAVTEEARLGNHPLTCRAVSVEGAVVPS
jgi:ATP-dependent Clp protease adaptor protein ClpS